jgi:TPR repeat protein
MSVRVARQDVQLFGPNMGLKSICEVITDQLGSCGQCGDVDAQVQYADHLREGKECTVDFVQAVEYYKRVTESGNVAAMLSYAYTCEAKHGPQCNLMEVARWYKAVMDSGSLLG